MTNLCPTCSHPLRTGAKFCGFCGADLSKPLKSEASSLPIPDDISGLPQGEELQGQVKTRRRDPWRVASIVAIILMIILIALALLVQYWVNLIPLIG